LLKLGVKLYIKGEEFVSTRLKNSWDYNKNEKRKHEYGIYIVKDQLSDKIEINALKICIVR
jgi:hypothetical protein